MWVPDSIRCKVSVLPNMITEHLLELNKNYDVPSCPLKFTALQLLREDCSKLLSLKE